MPEDIELAPDWLQEEILREPEQLREWLSGQTALAQQDGQPLPQVRATRRGRRPRQQR